MQHAPAVMPIRGFDPRIVTGIHEISETLGIPKTWIAGTTPGDDAKSDGSAGRIRVVSVTRNRRVSATFLRRRQCLTGQPWV